MITIQNGKLSIPDIDRFVGFAGDNSVNTKQLTVIDHVGEGCTYTLCLRFDDDTVRTVPLEASVDGGDTVLTWEIQSSQLHAAGVVAAQLRIADSDGNISHSTKDFFLIASSVELDEHGEEAEYVTPSQLRNSINQALQAVTATAPFIDEGGWWNVYDPEEGAYVRTVYHVSGISPDSAMSDSSDNTVSNKTVKRYVDAKAADCNTFAASYTDVKTAGLVPDTRRIAQLALSRDIGGAELMDALRPYLYKLNVTPNVSGTRGQIGIGAVGEVFFCVADNQWEYLATHDDLAKKMDLIPEISMAEVDDYDDGSLLFISGVLYVKYNDGLVALCKANDVYTKSEVYTKSDVYTKAEINTMIGNIETLLATV